MYPIVCCIGEKDIALNIHPKTGGSLQTTAPIKYNTQADVVLKIVPMKPSLSCSSLKRKCP
jgi:hypothetical protein